MPDLYRVAETITTLLHVVSSLSVSVAHLVGGDAVGAVNAVLIAAACILILSVAVAAAEIIRLLVRLLVSWCERRFLSAHRNKEGETPS